MALIVPDAASAITNFDVLDQAEPDQVDFEILGNLASNYVVSGGAVTTNGSASNVAVAAAVVVIQGRVYAMSAAPSQALPAAPVNKRFDLVIARLSGGAATATVVSGVDTANPVFPLSSSVTGSFSASVNYNPATDVVLAALYRPGSAVVTATRIVDKRIIAADTIVDSQSGSAPASTPGVSNAGVLKYKTGTPSGSSTGLYVGDQNGNYTEVAANAAGPQVPIGVPLPWPSRSAVPTNYVEANGQVLAVATYPTLFAAYQYDFGGNGSTTFAVPNIENNYVLKGTNQTASGQTNSPGAVVGSDTVVLATGNLPSHTHDLANHTHAFGHTHGIDHDHPSGNTGSVSNGHTHNVSITSGIESQQHSHYTGTAPGNATFLVQWITAGGPNAIPTGPGTGAYIYTDTATGVESSPHTHAVSGATADINANHTHVFDVANYSGATSSQSSSTTGTPSTNTSGSAGSATAVSTVQSSMYTRWIIRAL